MSDDFDEFKSYGALADKLIDAMDKEQVAECLRVMAHIWRSTNGDWEKSRDRTCLN